MIIFETDRLYVRKAQPIEKDIENWFELWNSGKVMEMVSFPEGLKINKQEIKKQFMEENSCESGFDSRLGVYLKETNEFIGECKLGFPDDKGISTTDVKLLPEFWGKSYGKEIKQALCLYLFTKTECKIVKADPNKLNIASHKMQEFCGGKIVGEHFWEPPKDSKRKRTIVDSYVYYIEKNDFFEKFPELNKGG